MLVWLVAEDGTFIDETQMDKAPRVGEKLTLGGDWQVVEIPAPDETAAKLGAQVLVVKSA
ncbi:MAG: hypothetical protein V3S98_08645 [Dehalococcoidia bacterium]